MSCSTCTLSEVKWGRKGEKYTAWCLPGQAREAPERWEIVWGLGGQSSQNQALLLDYGLKKTKKASHPQTFSQCFRHWVHTVARRPELALPLEGSQARGHHRNLVFVAGTDWTLARKDAFSLALHALSIFCIYITSPLRDGGLKFWEVTRLASDHPVCNQQSWESNWTLPFLGDFSRNEQASSFSLLALALRIGLLEKLGFGLVMPSCAEDRVREKKAWVSQLTLSIPLAS